MISSILVSRLLEYTPSARITPLQACAHTFFDELREPGTKLPNGREMPPLFNFTEAELKIQPTLNSQLIPSHMASGKNRYEINIKISELISWKLYVLIS